MLTSFPSLF